MTDNREIKFLEFNEDKLMQNLLEAEEHARIASDTTNSGHISCIIKHTLLAEGHANEGISHSLNNPYKTNLFKEVSMDVSNFRHNLMQEGFEQKKSLEELRDIRKKAEQLNPAYNTNNCKACTRVNPKSLNTNNAFQSNDYNIASQNQNIGGKRMADWKEFGVLTSGAFAGKFATWGTYELDKMVYPDVTGDQPGTAVARTALYKRPSVWVNVLGGLGVSIASLYMLKRKPSIKLFLASTGANMMTKSVDYLREAIAGKQTAIGNYPYYVDQPKVFIPTMPVRNMARQGITVPNVRRGRIQVV